MAPDEQQIFTAIRRATESIFKETPDALSVRAVRDKVVVDLGLDAEFFTSGEWKDKSKGYIKEYAAKVVDGQNSPTPSPVKARAKPAPKKSDQPVKNIPKRAAPKAKPAKRAKKAATPSDISDDDDEDISSEGSFDDDEESEAESSSFGDSDSESDRPKKKGRGKPVPQKMGSAGKSKASNRKRKAVSDDEDGQSSLSESEEAEESDASSVPSKKKRKVEAKKPAPKKSKTEETVAEGDEDEDEKASPPKKQSGSGVSDKLTKASSSPAPQAVASSNSRDKDAGSKSPEPSKGAENSDSEMSVVLDEAPAKKRKGASKPDSTKSTTSKASKPAVELSADEQLLKTLQTQLKKCGVKKIYQFTLSKQFGDDVKGKIKFLQKELRDVGMAGRFSEQRAREIKEMRELLDDVEAVQEGEKAWGLEDTGRRASRATAAKVKRRSLKESSGSEDDEVEETRGQKEDGSDDEEEEAPKPIRQRARQDLAFLDDEESD